MSREVRPVRRQFEARIIPALEGADAVVYSLVGLVFLVTAFGMLGYSVMRRILAIGAAMSIAGDTLSPNRFQQAMVDLSVNAGAILAIAIALYLLGRREVTEP